MKEHPTHKGYFLTEDGRIFSSWSRGKYPSIDIENLSELNPQKHYKNGYYSVQLGRNGKRHQLHRLMLETYQPLEDFIKYEVNHRDGDKSNNTISNLEWCTRKRNIVHYNNRTYWVQEPTGKITTTDNLKEYSREHNLSYGCLIKTNPEYDGIGKQIQHKGYKVLDVICHTQWK